MLARWREESYGGRTWRTLTGRFRHTCNAGATLDLSFADRRHGWLVWFEPTGRFSELYRTRDGGESWRMIRSRHAPSSPEQIVFSTPLRGWGTGSPPGSGPSRLLRTADGGRSWTREQGLPLARYALPIFSGEQGVIAAARRDSVSIYVSSDGGRSWRRRSHLRFGRAIGSVDLKSPAPGVWWVTAWSGWRAVLAVTSDGGRSWTRPRLRLATRGLAIVPTSGRQAWAASDGRLFVTTDRGQTWKRVQPR